MKMPYGATPLTVDDLAGLIPKLATRGELDEFEQANIADAVRWAQKSRKLKKELLSASGLLLLHERMFSKTWMWAGKQRVRVTNPGIDPSRIMNELGILLKEVEGWLEYGSYPLDEIAVRFHHRLVFIHPFPNGNGRHSRLAADLLLQYRKQTPLSWSAQRLSQESSARNEYIEALREADHSQDYGPLLRFAKGI